MGLVPLVNRPKIMVAAGECEFEAGAAFRAEGGAGQLAAIFFNDNGSGRRHAVFTVDRDREAGDGAPVLDARFS